MFCKLGWLSLFMQVWFGRFGWVGLVSCFEANFEELPSSSSTINTQYKAQTSFGSQGVILDGF